MNYFALIGDIIDSKKIDNRYQVEKILETCLNDLNTEFKEVLVSKLSITLGDEFQGLLTLDAPLFQIPRCKMKCNKKTCSSDILEFPNSV